MKIMNLKTATLICITTIYLMFGNRNAFGEELVKSDGKVSATVLPLDKKTAATKYETAIFGLG